MPPWIFVLGIRRVELAFDEMGKVVGVSADGNQFICSFLVGDVDQTTK